MKLELEIVNYFPDIRSSFCQRLGERIILSIFYHVKERERERDKFHQKHKSQSLSCCSMITIDVEQKFIIIYIFIVPLKSYHDHEAKK